MDAIAISAGGEMAEEMCGILDNSGCGSDRFKQNMLANLYVGLTGSIRSVGDILSEQRSRARGVLESIGSGVHMQRSIRLLRAGIIV